MPQQFYQQQVVFFFCYHVKRTEYETISYRFLDAVTAIWNLVHQWNSYIPSFVMILSRRIQEAHLRSTILHGKYWWDAWRHSKNRNFGNKKLYILLHLGKWDWVFTLTNFFIRFVLYEIKIFWRWKSIRFELQLTKIRAIENEKSWKFNHKYSLKCRCQWARSANQKKLFNIFLFSLKREVVQWLRFLAFWRWKWQGRFRIGITLTDRFFRKNLTKFKNNIPNRLEQCSLNDYVGIAKK